MAEKEDYIVISKKDFDYKKGHYVTHLAKQVPRQDAIERMAKALCSCQTGGCKKCYAEDNKEACLCVLIDGLYTRHAEAALDALLSKED